MTRTLRTLALVLLLAACGGGVETGGTGATGSSYVDGPITGFGSIIVGGVRFDDSNARVEDADGALRSRDELRLGMRVQVDGGAIGTDAGGARNATATRVRIGSELLGPITGAVSASVIEVLGQSVQVRASTVVDGVAGGVTVLQPGDIVEVAGFVEPGTASDAYVATRIERRSVAPAAYRVRGIVRDLAGSVLRVGSQSFDLSGVSAPSGLANGVFVRLTVATQQVGGRWPVTAASIDARRIDDRDDAEVEGLITALTSTTRFAVDGVEVDAGAARFNDGTAGVVLGARVKVRGRSTGGQLIASEVELRDESTVFNEGIDVRDVIQTLDTAAKTFVVRGVVVDYSQSPRYDNGSETDLANGVNVRVRGMLSADRTRAVATRIEFLR
jgi:hypothetical protein